MPQGEPLARIAGFDVHTAAQFRDGDTTGMLFTGQAEGAIPTGARVAKCNTEPGDSFVDGTLGTVLASARVPRREQVPPFLDPPEFGYYVAWDSLPGVPVFVAGRRIRAL